MALLPPPRLAAAADAVALLAFAVVGLLSHDHAVTNGGLARDGLPLLGGWFAAAALLRLYARPSAARLAATWLVGVPAGVLVRALALGRTEVGREAAFLAVSLAFTALFVVALRVLATRAGRSREPRHP